jgi:branched-chain amino acid transport system permease protein
VTPDPLVARSHALQAPLGTAALRSLGPWAVVLAAALVLHLVISPLLPGYYIKILTDVGIAIVLGVSLNLVNGFTGQFSIGHAGFMAVGGYVAGTITYYGHYLLWGGIARQGGFFGPSELLFVAGALAGGLAAGVAGYVVGLPSLRLRGDYLAIVTLGFGEILRVLVQRTDDVLFVADDIAKAPLTTLATSVGGALGFTGIPFLTNLFWVAIAVGAVLVLSYRLKHSDQGRGFLAIREDEVAAEAMGVPTTRLKVRAFVYAAFFAGIAGALFAHEVGTTLYPRELGFQKIFEVVIMVVLGGMGSISGTTLAAIVLTVLPELLREFSQYRMIAYALLLIGMMLLRPQGLFGIHEIWELRFRRAKVTG